MTEEIKKEINEEKKENININETTGNINNTVLSGINQEKEIVKYNTNVDYKNLSPTEKIQYKEAIKKELAETISKLKIDRGDYAFHFDNSAQPVEDLNGKFGKIFDTVNKEAAKEAQRRKDYHLPPLTNEEADEKFTHMKIIDTETKND